MEVFNINMMFKHLEHDRKSDIQILKLIDDTRSLLIAELKAGKELPAHYHNEGSEIYQILLGEGNIKLGELSGDDVVWNDSFIVSTGDIFQVKPKIVHKLSNSSNEPLQIIFIAPPSHLDEDRVFL